MTINELGFLSWLPDPGEFLGFLGCLYLRPAHTWQTPSESKQHEGRDDILTRLRAIPDPLNNTVIRTTFIPLPPPPLTPPVAIPGRSRSAIVLLPAAALNVQGFVVAPPRFSSLAAGTTGTTVSAGLTTRAAAPAPRVLGLPRSVRHRSGRRSLAGRTARMMAAPSTAGKGEEGEGETEEGFVLPRAPLPEIIVSNVPGSWAYDTMVCMYTYTHARGRFLQCIFVRGGYCRETRLP